MPGLTSVINSFGEKLGERWFEALFTPALMFWVAGALLWSWGPAYSGRNWSAAFAFVRGLDAAHEVLLAVAALVGIVVSGVLAERFTLPLLRLFQGYWPGWCEPLTARLVARWERRRTALTDAWQPLQMLAQARALSQAELPRYVALSQQLRELPDDAKYDMPTRIGNILRAAERRPSDRYGLDAIVCWPRLWLVMPDSAKSDLSDARAKLDVSARLMFWSLAFVAWCLSSWLALPVAAVLAWYAYGSMIEAATAYALLFESAYDVQRRALYKSVGFAYPATAAQEYAKGKILTAYLLRGSHSTAIALQSGD